MKISVVTTTRNCADMIDDTLESVANQTYCNREHIVMDGGSIDGTLEILQRRRGQLAVLTSEPDGGVYFGLNKGLARACGDAVGFLHGDDLFADREVLSRVATAFADPEVDAVYGDLLYVAADDTSRVIRDWRAGEYRPQRLGWGWMPPHPSLFLRRSLYQQFGNFDTRYRIAADYDLMLRMLSRLQGKIVYIPQVLVRMRVGGISNRSLRNIARKSWEDYRALRNNRIGGVGALAWKNISKLPQFVRRNAGEKSVASRQRQER